MVQAIIARIEKFRYLFFIQELREILNGTQKVVDVCILYDNKINSKIPVLNYGSLPHLQSTTHCATLEYQQKY